MRNLEQFRQPNLFTVSEVKPQSECMLTLIIASWQRPDEKWNVSSKSWRKIFSTFQLYLGFDKGFGGQNRNDCY